MKTITKLLIIIFTIICLSYYYEIDVVKTFRGFFEKENQVNNNTAPFSEIDINKISTSTGTDNSTFTENNTSTVIIPDNKIDKPQEEETDYKEIVDFIIAQKKDKKLVESYRVYDKGSNQNLKGRSYIYDNALAVLALTSVDNEDARSTAADILRSLSIIQNKDGSWYDFYDISGQTVKISGKEYTKANTGNNSLVLYAYSYYKILTGDDQFKDSMKKSANFIMSRSDGKTEGLYDNEVSSKGSRSLASNVYSYFALREYSMASIYSDYQEFKSKLGAADRVASFVINNCFEKGVFISGYKGKDKDTSSNIDTYILGSLLSKSSKQGEKIKYEAADLENLLSKLYKNIGGLEGYKVDTDKKNNGYIWCEGTSKIPVVFLKLGSRNRSNDVLGFIENYKDIVPKSLSPRGIPYSTNVDKNIDVTGVESVSSSAWTIMANKCYSDDNINNIFFGREEDVFNMVTRE